MLLASAVVPAAAAASAASSTDPANCHLQVQQGTPLRAARLGLRTASVTVREKETHLKQQNWASWPAQQERFERRLNPDVCGGPLAGSNGSRPPCSQN